MISGILKLFIHNNKSLGRHDSTDYEAENVCYENKLLRNAYFFLEFQLLFTIRFPIRRPPDKISIYVKMLKSMTSMAHVIT